MVGQKQKEKYLTINLSNKYVLHRTCVNMTIVCS